MNIWSDTVLGPAMRPQIYGDFIRCIDPGDRAYFRSSREAQLGMTLEQYCADRDAALPAVGGVAHRCERTLSEQPFLAGEAPAYVDYIVFSVFQWARIGSPRDVLRQVPVWMSLRDWRTRMVALYDDLGRPISRLSDGGHMISYD